MTGTDLYVNKRHCAAAVQCGLFTHKSVPVIFEPPCINNVETMRHTVETETSMKVTFTKKESNLVSQLQNRHGTLLRLRYSFHNSFKSSFS